MSDDFLMMASLSGGTASGTATVLGLIYLLSEFGAPVWIPAWLYAATFLFAFVAGFGGFVWLPGRFQMYLVRKHYSDAKLELKGQPRAPE